MNNNFENSPSLSDKDIFTKIWTSPRQVFKFINDKKYDKYVIALLIIAGINRAFTRASDRDMGDNSSLIVIIASSVLLGGLLGWISFYLYAALISWSGKWFNGKGSTKSILRALSYAMIPTIISLLIIFIQIGFYGIELFQSSVDYDTMGLIPSLFFYLTLIVQMVLGIWTIILSVVGVSEVQQISKGKALLNLLLPALFIIIPILLIIALFTAI